MSHIKFIAVFIAGILDTTYLWAQNPPPIALQDLAYTTLYVGLDYAALNQPVATFTQITGGGKATISGCGASVLYRNKILCRNFVSDRYGNVSYNHNLTAYEFKFLSETPICQKYNSDPNILQCNLSVNGRAWPVIINNGLRAKTIEEMVSNRTGGLGGYTLSTTGNPYYYEVSAIPSDKISVDLSQYFTNGWVIQGDITYSLDATAVGGVAGGCVTPLITGINQTTCADKTFTITGPNLTAKSLTTGVYQINVKATSSQHNEVAYHTFYINVNDSNHSFSDWQQGKVAKTNVIGQYNSIYSYSNQDPAQGGNWDADYKSYGKDLFTINANANYLKNNPIKTVFLELSDVQYSGVDTITWPVGPNGQISAGQVITNRSSQKNWNTDLETLKNDFNPASGASLVGITLSYTFANAVKAEMVGFNDEQRQLVAELMVQPIIDNNLDGVSMDLEGGFNQPNANALYKQITDRLAYHGKWFSFYYFADMFGPATIAAFGPLGVANISTYDVGQYRAPKTADVASALPGSISYDSQQLNKTLLWSSDNLDILFGDSGFTNDNTCTTIGNSGVYSPVSYCNLTTQDSYSENNRRFMNSYQAISTHDAMINFNGKYQLAFPLAASATEWEYVEFWQPDLSAIPSGGGMIVTAKNSCEGLDNIFFSDKDKELDDNTTEAYKQVAACLMSNTLIPATTGVPMQSFGRCKNPTNPNNETPIPYASCLQISNLPSGVSRTDFDNTTTIETIDHANVLDYIAQNSTVYCDANKEHYVGYSLFALENQKTAAQGAFQSSSASNQNQSSNKKSKIKDDPKKPHFLMVQEPWYVGFHPPTLPSNIISDPYYYKPYSQQLWQNLGPILAGIQTCTPAPQPKPPVCGADSFPNLASKCLNLLNTQAPQNVTVNLDPALTQACVGYCSKNGISAGQQSNGASLSAVIGTGIFVMSDEFQCYENNNKNGGNNVGPNTSGVFITQQYNQPKCTIETAATPSSCSTMFQNSKISCPLSSTPQSINVTIDGTLPQGTCIAYCDGTPNGKSIDFPTTTPPSTISVVQGTNVYLNAINSPCYDNNGDNVGPNIEGILIDLHGSGPNAYAECKYQRK